MGCKNLLLQILIKKYGGFSNVAERSVESSFFRDIHVTNSWYLHFPKAYRHKNWTPGIFIGVKPIEPNQAGTGDIIMSRADFKKTL